MGEYFYYRLIAYVGRGKNDPAPLWAGDDGFKPYGTIYNARPDWSRFAVLQRSDKKYLCVDLFETKLDLETYTLLMPPPMEFDDLDAAVVTAQLKL